MIRFACIVILELTVTVQIVAQEVLPQVSWFSFPVCNSIETDDHDKGASASIEAISALLEELPPGRERKVAQKLLYELVGERLQGFCNDSQTGAFLAASSGGLGSRSTELRIVLGNRSVPEIEVDVTALPNNGGFGYVYRVTNKTYARAPIATWGLMTSKADHGIKMTHPIWQVVPSVRQSNRVRIIAVRENTEISLRPVLSTAERHFSRWTTPLVQHAIQAGSSLSLFTVTSDYRPGWTTAYVGSRDTIRIPDLSISKEITAGLEVLSRLENYYSSVLTIGPKFGPDIDRSWIAGDWHLGIQMMIAHGLLSANSRYVSELLSSLSRIAQSEVRINFEVDRKPSDGMESVIDKIVRMALL